MCLFDPSDSVMTSVERHSRLMSYAHTNQEAVGHNKPTNPSRSHDLQGLLFELSLSQSDKYDRRDAQQYRRRHKGQPHNKATDCAC